MYTIIHVCYHQSPQATGKPTMGHNRLPFQVNITTFTSEFFSNVGTIISERLHGSDI